MPFQQEILSIIGESEWIADSTTKKADWKVFGITVIAHTMTWLRERNAVIFNQRDKRYARKIVKHIQYGILETLLAPTSEKHPKQKNGKLADQQKNMAGVNYRALLCLIIQAFRIE